MRAICALAFVMATGCKLDWPDASRGDELGPEGSVDEGPLHRPGQPCTWCHGGPSPRAPVWELAGTVYLRAGDAVGLEGATITVTDAAGAEHVLRSNEAGNFWISLGTPGGGDPGELRVAAQPVFPLHVKITHGGTEQAMRNVIGREASCATCHADPPGATTVGKVFVLEPTP